MRSNYKPQTCPNNSTAILIVIICGKLSKHLSTRKDVNFSEFCSHVQSYLAQRISLDVYCTGAVLLCLTTLIYKKPYNQGTLK